MQLSGLLDLRYHSSTATRRPEAFFNGLFSSITWPIVRAMSGWCQCSRRPASPTLNMGPTEAAAAQ
jgi:hypothetical protein